MSYLYVGIEKLLPHLLWRKNRLSLFESFYFLFPLVAVAMAGTGFSLRVFFFRTGDVGFEFLDTAFADFLLELLSRKLKQAGTRAPVGSGLTPSCAAVGGQAAGPSADLGKRSRGDEEVRVEEGSKKARVEEGDSSSGQRSGGDRSRKTDRLRRESSLDEHDLALGEEGSESSSGPPPFVPPPVFETSSADQGAPAGDGGASDLGESVFVFC